MTGYSTDGCPADEPIDLDVVQHDHAEDELGLYLRRASERGRHEIVLGSIKAHLEEQPTPGAVYAAVRNWVADVTALGEKVAKTKRSTS